MKSCDNIGDTVEDDDEGVEFEFEDELDNGVETVDGRGGGLFGSLSSSIDGFLLLTVKK